MAGERFKQTDQIKPSEPQSNNSGLDMRPTIDWYSGNTAKITGLLPQPR